MRESVGSLDDIDRIIIVGGASHLYEKAVLDLFKGYDVRIAKDAIFSNARGFQLIANVAAKKGLIRTD